MNNKDRTIVITGASTGIGLAIARQLAEAGSRLIMVSHDSARGTAAVDEVARVATGAEPVFIAADLSSQRAIRDLAAELHSRVTAIDVLINNAGTAAGERLLTVDGLERTFAVNHLGPFLLTNLLRDVLVAAPAARVINTVSETHARRYTFFSAYARSKLAEILFTYELARRLKPVGVTANCFTPGPTATDFGRGTRGFIRVMSELMRVIGRRPEESARIAVHLALSPEMDGVTGQYFYHDRAARSKPVTYDLETAAWLWRVSSALTQAANPMAMEATR